MQVSKPLIVKKEIIYDSSKEFVVPLDFTMADYYLEQKEDKKGLDIIKKLLPDISDDKKEITKKRYVEHALEYGKILQKEQKWIEAIEIYRDLMDDFEYPISVYKSIGICLREIGSYNLAIQFFQKFEEISKDKEDIYLYLAEIFYKKLNNYLKAIEYYEKALPTTSNKCAIYNMLGHLYSTYYQDKEKDKQIEYLTKAYEVSNKNRIVVKNLAYVYGKFDEEEKANEFYSKLMQLNPTHADLHAYGAYLVKHQQFKEGFKLLQHRFLKEDLDKDAFPSIFNNKKKRWNLKTNIKNKNILVHYEQGFGDTIMFARFVEQLKPLCKKVSLVVQDSLYDLFVGSQIGVDVYKANDISKINYDYYIPMMDLPIICELTPKTIPLANGYLSVSKAKVNEFKKKFINKNEKLKIGIAYEGTLASKETDRDIPLEFLYPLMRMPQVEVYCFQVDDAYHQMDRLPEDVQLIKLSSVFNNWEDTACAMKCMDLIVTTDNGILNLAGALGVKTFGLFNKITEWRWFKTDGKDIAWYKSVKPFQAPTSKAWDVPVKEIVEEVEKLQCQKLAKALKKIR